MKFAVSLVLSLSLVLCLVASAAAAEKTLKGRITCAKCELKKEDAKKCATVVVVKAGDKEELYYFDKDADKKYHKDICTTPKPGSVTGVIEEKDGKKWITKVTKVEYE